MQGGGEVMPKKERVFSPGTSSLTHSVGQYVSQGCLYLLTLVLSVTLPGENFARKFLTFGQKLWDWSIGLEIPAQ